MPARTTPRLVAFLGLGCLYLPVQDPVEPKPIAEAEAPADASPEVALDADSPQEVSAEATQESLPEVVLPELGGWSVSGYLDSRVRVRWQSRRSQSDADLLVGGFFDGALANDAGEEVLRYQVDGLFTADLDGFGSLGDAFVGLQEARNDRLHAYLYEAWVESSALVDGAEFRVGRQLVAREDAIYFDGLRVDHSPAAGWGLVAYAGIPVHFHESSREGDFLAGIGARWAVDPRVRLEVDEVFVRDEQRYFGASTPVIANNNLTLLSASWLADEQTMVRGTASWLGDQDRRQSVSVAWAEPVSGWRATVMMRRQNDYGELAATEYSPYAALLGDVAPYWTTSVDVQKSILEHLHAGVSYSARRLEDVADEGLYNREWDRYSARLTADEFLAPELDVGVQADIWDSGADRMTSTGAFAGWEWAEKSRFEVGTDFALYRFDVFTRRERLNDREYYARAKLPVTDDVSMAVRYALNHSRFGTNHLAEVLVSLEF